MNDCPKCSAKNRPGANFCNICGKPLQKAYSPPATVLPTVAGAGSQGITQLARLTLIGTTQTYPLTGTTLLGREPTQCQITFDKDLSISRCHARLEYLGGHWPITDLSSSHGTWVNKTKILQTTELQTNDKVEIGQATELIFEDLSPNANQLSIVIPPKIVPTPPGQLLSNPQSGSNQPLSPRQPMGGWKIWPPKSQPAAEGFITDASQRYAVSRPNLKKGGLGVVLSAATKLPLWTMFDSHDQVHQQDLRLEDYHTGREMAVVIMGEGLLLQLGEPMAVWGKMNNGVIQARQFYHYPTGQTVAVKK